MSTSETLRLALVLYVVVLGLGSLVEESEVLPTIALTALLFVATLTATVALMAPKARGYLRRSAE